MEHQETVGKTIKTILEMDVPAKVRANDLIRSELKPILIRAMAFDPDDRYTWVDELVADLHQIVKRSSLDMNSTAFSQYMKQLFQREMILDARRMRKLLTERLPEQVRSTNRGNSGERRRTSDKAVSTRQHLQPAAVEDSPPAQDLPNDLHAHGVSISIPAGKTIYRRGDRANQVYLLDKGKVKLWLQIGRKKRTIGLLRAGDFFGEMALLGDNFHLDSARAEEDSELTLLDKRSLQPLESHELVRKLVSSALMKLKNVESVIESDLLEDSLGRLIYGLLLFHGRSSELNGKDINLNELAEVLSLEDKEELKKYLRKLEALDVIRVDQNTVRVDDTKKLENILKVLSRRGELTLKL